MKVPGFGDRTTTNTTTDPLTGETLIRAGDATHTTRVHEETVPISSSTTVRETASAPVGGALTAKELQREVNDAYERGKRDQRKAQKNHPLLTLLIVLLAVLGVAVGVLALQQGSFSGAGRVLDRGTATAAEEAREAAVDAKDAAGEATQDAGAAIQSTGEAVERDAEAEQRP